MNLSHSFNFVSRSPDDTRKFGEGFGRRLQNGACVSLVGSLGAGKTVAISGICRGLGVDEAVVSPTFILYEEFRGRLRVIHVDLYRLEHESEIEELGLFDVMGGPVVVLVEWGDRSETVFEQSGIVIKIEYLTPTERNIVVSYHSSVVGVFEDKESWLP